MYNSGLVCVVKSNGNILREDKDVCFLPFNSEYSLLIKNLETKKVLVKVTIDGQDVLDGNSLIIYPNNELELEGFMKGNVAKNKFKFIEKTKEISDYRKDRIDDGIIRIEYQFEKIYEQKIEHIYCHYFNNYTPIWQYQNQILTNDYNKYDGEGYTVSCFNGSNPNFEANNSNDNNCNCFCNDNGITVKGSEVNQQFIYSNIGCLEENKRVIILRLIGKKESGIVIEKPLTIKTKKICSTCGRKSKSHLKFCPNCGTFLE